MRPASPTWRSSSAPAPSAERGATTPIPGRCDVASNLYSFSFAPNPAWTNTYSYQPEIWRYLQNVADEYQLRDLIRYDHDVLDVSFDGPSKTWRLTTSQGDYHAHCVILATGGLAAPRLPDIAGLSLFQGPIMHRSDEHTSELQSR